jgi:hypothetical protein
MSVAHVDEVDRLTLEAEVWQDEARTLIRLAGPAATARCLDACCGPLGSAGRARGRGAERPDRRAGG